MTKFIDCSDEQKETKETVFTHILSDTGWVKSYVAPNGYLRVIYLGKCKIDGDMFASYSEEHIEICKGTKGNEF